MTKQVTPFMGVWIEIIWSIILSTILLSLPLWECGLKYLQWPEPYFHHPVTPFMGVWIEILFCCFVLSYELSLPLWECGLK